MNVNAAKKISYFTCLFPKAYSGFFQCSETLYEYYNVFYHTTKNIIIFFKMPPPLI